MLETLKRICLENPQLAHEVGIDHSLLTEEEWPESSMLDMTWPWPAVAGGFSFFVNVACGASMVVGPEGLSGALLRRQGGASACTGPLQVVVLWRRRGACDYLDHEQAARVVQSGGSLHRLTAGMMAATLGCRFPH
jgi:hypothetical protein